MESLDLPSIYEDEYIVAIDKLSGVMTHPDGRAHAQVDSAGEKIVVSTETASDWFARAYPESSMVGETQRLQNGDELLRPGVVHRLDRETSGVLIFAKTPEAHLFYKKAFQEHEVRKTYLAFVYGVLTDRKGSIEFAIGRSRKDFRLRSAQPKAKGTLREALTRYEVISDIGTHSLIKAMPLTGRTHQIRVHMKAIHHPIVCDHLYAPNHKCDLGFDRLGLHSYELDIPLMTTEKVTEAAEGIENISFTDSTRLTLRAPLPQDMAQAAARFPNTETYRK
jgi:23S rRNA pseudouridine1911/1915/1917 synthase